MAKRASQSGDAWVSFREAADEHDQKNHDFHMKRKRDELQFDLHLQEQTVLTRFALLDKQTSIGLHKLYIDEKKLALDEKKLAFDVKKLALDEQQLEFDCAKKSYLESEAALIAKEEILRHSKYVCSICLDAVSNGNLCTLNPCGHCFCKTCIREQGIVLVDPTEPYHGHCPTCRGQVDTLLNVFL
jgi:hypothetical protein